jgi:hypothetical protein
MHIVFTVAGRIDTKTPFKKKIGCSEGNDETPRLIDYANHISDLFKNIIYRYIYK